MLTYATLEDFKIAKQIKKIKQPDISAEQLALADDKIIDYLRRATRYIDRFTRRQFFPWRERRSFSVPHKYLDLSMKRFLSADLPLDNDLLYVYELKNGANVTLTEGTDYFLLHNNIFPKTAIQLKFPNFWGGTYGLSVLSRSFDEPIIHIDGIWGYHELYSRPDEAWTFTNQKLGTGGIDASETLIDVSDITLEDNIGMKAFLPGYMLRIDDEFMELTETISDTTDQIKVIRGIRGTTAVAHDEDAKIYRWRVHEDIVEASIQIAKTWRESDTSAGGRLGVSDMSAGVEIGIPADPLNTIKMYQRSLINING